MTTYNPYAYQGYELNTSKVQKTVSIKHAFPTQNDREMDLHINDSAPAVYSDVKPQLTNSSAGQLRKTNIEKQLYKWIFCFMVILLFVTSFYLVRASAITSSTQLEAMEEESIIVGSGDTLWRIASTHYTHIADKGYAIFLIKERNGLQTDTINPGDKLILPSH